MASPGAPPKREVTAPAAWISPDAVIEEDVEIGPCTIVHSGVRIGRGTKVGGFCELGIPTDLATSKGLSIGANSVIRSHSVFYDGSRFGPHLRTGHHVTARENVTAGEYLQIGTRTELDRGTRCGNHVRLHSNVMTSEGTVIRDFALIFPNVVLTNCAAPPSDELCGPTVETYAVIAVGAILLPGVTVGEGALVGVGTVVREDVPPEMICVGVPGRIVGHVGRLKPHADGKPAYPWRRHFHRGYPADIVEQWQAEFRDEPASDRR